MGRLPWASHRIPLPLIPLARDFAKQFLPEAETLLPEEPRQLPLDIDTCRLRWVQTTEQRLINDTVTEVEHTLADAVGNRFDLHAPGDFVLLVDSNERGRELVDSLSLGEATTSRTHSPPQACEARAAKKAFFLGGRRPRATTAHSFKGWEAPAIVVCLARGANHQALCLLYSAITRLEANSHGSDPTVVSAESRLDRYGKTWPDSLQRF